MQEVQVLSERQENIEKSTVGRQNCAALLRSDF